MAISSLAIGLWGAGSMRVWAFDSAKRDAGLQAAFDGFPLLKADRCRAQTNRGGFCVGVVVHSSQDGISCADWWHGGLSTIIGEDELRGDGAFCFRGPPSRYMQRLTGTAMGMSRRIWSRFRCRTSKPNKMSLKFGFADLGKKREKLPPLEKSAGVGEAAGALI